MCESCLIIITQTHNYSFFALIINYPCCPFPLVVKLFMSSFVAPSYILRGTQFGPCFEKWLSLLPSRLGSPLVKGPASCSVPRWQVSHASPVTHAASLQGGSFISFSREHQPPPCRFLFSIVAKRADSETRFRVHKSQLCCCLAGWPWPIP